MHPPRARACPHCSRCRATSRVRSSLSATERLGRDDDLAGDLGGSDGGGEAEAAAEAARFSASFSACRMVEVEVWAEVRIEVRHQDLASGGLT